MPLPRNNQDRRSHGFQPPFTPAQVATWIALPMLVIEFLVFVSPILPLEASIPCTIAFALTAVLAAYYAYLATVTDPLDEHLAKHLKKKASGEDESNNNNGFGGCLGNPGEEVEPLKHCWICETQVAEHAMHCKFCNKCIGGFDHHCLWLNNCIGKTNYQYFLSTMNYITLVLLVHGAVQVGLIIDIFLDGETRDKADDWFQTEASNAIVGIMIGFAAFDGIALSLILQLVFFHMQLRKEGLTTYKFIVRETQKKREKRDNEQDRKNKRMVAMGKANDEGNYMLACKLRYGEMIPCIDPLPKDGVEEKKEEDTQRPHNDVSSDDVGPASGSQQIQQPANGAENGHRTETDKQDSIDEENEELPPQEDEEAGPNCDVKKGENGNSDGVQFIKVSEGDS